MPKSPSEQEKPSVIANEAKQSHLENSDERRKGIEIVVAGVSAAAVLAMAKEASAATPFDDAVNNIDPGLWREALGGQLTAGPTSDRFDMVFPARTPSDHQGDLYRAQLQAEVGPDGGITFRRLGLVNKDPLSNPDGSEGDGNCIEYTRPDGRKDIVLSPGRNIAAGFINFNGENVWPTGCGGEFSGGLHPSARDPRTLKVAVNFDEAFGTVDEDIYRVSIDAPVDEAAGVNFCTDIRDRILAANALGPGHNACTEGVLQCNAESISWRGDTRAPETPEFEIVANGPNVRNMLKFNPLTNQYDIFMERGVDGCYTEECAPPYDACVSLNSEEGLGNPSALLTTPLRIRDGATTRTIYPYVAEYTTSAGGEGPYPNGRPHLQAMAFEVGPGGTICEVPVTMEADEAAVVDDDGDGIANEDDTCAWVAEAGNIDASGPSGAADGIGDACQTACNEWPAVNPPDGTGPSDVWVCQSTEIQGYNHQLKRGDGSTLLTSFEVPAGEFDDGDLDLPPGGDFYWMHAQAAQYQGEEVPSPEIAFPAGNSANIEILSTDHPDGTPGTATFMHFPYPSGAPVVTPLGIGTHNFDPGIGDVLGLSGTVVRGSAGNENWPVSCDNGCIPAFPEGGGTPACPVECDPPVVDGGADGGAAADGGGGTDAGPGGSDAGPGGADAGPRADAGPTCPPVCDPQPDGGTPDGGVDAGGGDAGPTDSGAADTPDAADPTDANNPDPPDGQPDGQNPDPKPDSGPNTQFDGGTSHRADNANTGHDEDSDNGGGCNCTISQPDRSHNAHLSMDGISIMTPIIAALIMRRRKRFTQFIGTMFTAANPE